MPTNPGQGNNTQAATYPPSGVTTNVYIYTTSGTLVVGTVVYWTADASTLAPAGTYKIVINNVVKKYTVNSSGVITNITDCVWTSTQYVSSQFTGTKNNCVAGSCSVTGSSVTLNDGNSANAYVTSGTYTSNISQADADAQALALAQAAFEAGKQNKVNELGFCTYTYSSGSGTCSQNFTRNNCGNNCYGSSTVNYSNTKTGYSATSTVSCQAAIDAANTAAYNAACADVAANGQNYANANSGCCCWEYETYCVPGGCSLRSRERNNCTGETRNDSLVSASTCSCGVTCGGTYWSYYCSDTTRMRELRYNCDGSYAGTTETFQTCDQPNCGASTTPIYTPQNYTTCISCYNAPVYRDTNGCSGTSGQYYYETQAGNKVLIGFSQPSGTPCNSNSNCVDSGSAYCSGPNWVINQTQGNSCSTASCSVRVIEFNSQTNGCYTPPPACFNYNIIRITTSGSVTGNYTTCNGAATTFNLTRPDGSTGSVGTICARQGTVSITSGNGQVQTGSSCNNT